MTTAPDRTGLSRADILPMDEYARIRADKRREMVAIKKNRRVSVGPSATFHFESYETMWLQIHEMLYIEKGGEEQIADELRAYNPLIPKGDELVATLMFEIDDPVRRANLLNRLGGVENTITLRFAGETVTAVPERDVERTSEEGKASSVNFVHFTLTPEQIAKFRREGTQVILGEWRTRYAGDADDRCVQRRHVQAAGSVGNHFQRSPVAGIVHGRPWDGRHQGNRI